MTAVKDASFSPTSQIQTLEKLLDDTDLSTSEVAEKVFDLISENPGVAKELHERPHLALMVLKRFAEINAKESTDELAEILGKRVGKTSETLADLFGAVVVSNFTNMSVQEKGEFITTAQVLLHDDLTYEELSYVDPSVTAKVWHSLYDKSSGQVEVMKYIASNKKSTDPKKSSPEDYVKYLLRYSEDSDSRRTLLPD